MSYVIAAARTAMLLLSLLGYVHTLSKRMRVEFSIPTVLASIGSALFFAGILNVLAEASVLIFAGGLCLAARAVWKRESLRQLFCFGTLFLVLCAIFFLYLLHGTKFTSYDDFSHWGTVEKVLLQNGRFPNFLDRQIGFQSYPPGSAAFIYYFAFISGIHSEWFQLYIQAMLCACAVTGLFAFPARTATALLTAVCSPFLLFSLAGSYFVLGVDALLSLMALGGIAFCIYYRDHILEMIPWTVPYTVFLVAIKNSGALFSAVLVVYILIHAGKSRRAARALVSAGLCPVLTLVLWQKHIKLVFSDGLNAKHSMSLSYLSAIFEDKTPEDVHAILSGYLHRLLSPANEAVWLLALLILLAVVCRFCLRGERRVFRRHAVFLILVYAAYMAGLLGMYLFSMPTNEAIVLGSFDRYHQTVLTFAAGVLLILSIPGIEQLLAEKKLLPALALAISLVLCLALAMPFSLSSVRRQQYASTTRETYDRLIREYGIPSGKAYLVLVTDDLDGNGYRFYMTRYLLDPASVTVLSVGKLQADPSLLEKNDYIIVLDGSDAIRAYVEQTFGEPYQEVIPLRR